MITVNVPGSIDDLNRFYNLTTVTESYSDMRRRMFEEMNEQDKQRGVEFLAPIRKISEDYRIEFLHELELKGEEQAYKPGMFGVLFPSNSIPSAVTEPEEDTSGISEESLPVESEDVDESEGDFDGDSEVSGESEDVDEPEGGFDGISDEDEDTPEGGFDGESEDGDTPEGGFDGESEDTDEPEGGFDGVSDEDDSTPELVSDETYNESNDFLDNTEEDLVEHEETKVEELVGVSDTRPQVKPQILDIPQRTESVKVSSYEAPASLREFIKQYPYCTMEDAMRYFSKHEIQKEINLGRVVLRKGKLSL